MMRALELFGKKSCRASATFERKGVRSRCDTDTAFREGFVEADGFRIRYMEAGQGTPLVHLHGAGGMRLTRGHDLLSRHYRVIAFEMPGFGQSPENTRTQTMAELAATMAAAVSALGIDKFNLMGTSFGGKAALWLAVQSRHGCRPWSWKRRQRSARRGPSHRPAHRRK